MLGLGHSRFLLSFKCVVYYTAKDADFNIKVESWLCDMICYKIINCRLRRENYLKHVKNKLKFIQFR